MEEWEAGVCAHWEILLGIVGVERCTCGNDDELVVLHRHGFGFAGCPGGIDEGEYISEAALWRNEGVTGRGESEISGVNVRDAS